MRSPAIALLLISLAVASGEAQPAWGGPVDAGSTLISSHGIGPVHLGATLDSIARVVPGAALARVSDGDGAALVELTMAPDAVIGAVGR